MNIKRNDVYQGLVQEGLKYLLNLKLQFGDAVSIMELLNHIDKMVKWIKTPFYIQVANYGGSIIRGAEKPPYYSFQNYVDQTAFELSFNQYINQDEKLDDFNIIDVEISSDDYDKLPKTLESDLSGIVNLIII